MSSQCRYIHGNVTCRVLMEARLSLFVVVCGVACCSGFAPAASKMAPRSHSACTALQRGAVLMEDKRYSDDVYNAASAQQIPTIKAVAAFAVIYIGGQLVLGEEGTLAFGRWLSEGPFGPIWNVLSSPIVARSDVVSHDTLLPSVSLPRLTALYILSHGRRMPPAPRTTRRFSQPAGCLSSSHIISCGQLSGAWVAQRRQRPRVRTERSRQDRHRMTHVRRASMFWHTHDLYACV